MQHFKCGALRPPNCLSDIFHIVDMESDEVTNGVDTSGPSSRWHPSAINLRLGSRRPFPHVVVSQESLGRVVSFAADPDLPDANCRMEAITDTFSCTNSSH
jgi:hypothetical protein